ncbi:MAG: hypothetical protein CL682_14665, partial [Brevundimonas sp.]|nr:hypothetical protein [Brevundimonas sp.]
EGAGDAKWLEFARKHHEMIQQFGRFPHRNAVLGRMTRSEEEDVIADGADW